MYGLNSVLSERSSRGGLSSPSTDAPVPVPDPDPEPEPKPEPEPDSEESGRISSNVSVGGGSWGSANAKISAYGFALASPAGGGLALSLGRWSREVRRPFDAFAWRGVALRAVMAATAAAAAGLSTSACLVDGPWRLIPPDDCGDRDTGGELVCLEPDAPLSEDSRLASEDKALPRSDRDSLVFASEPRLPLTLEQEGARLPAPTRPCANGLAAGALLSGLEFSITGARPELRLSPLPLRRLPAPLLAALPQLILALLSAADPCTRVRLSVPCNPSF